MAPKFGTSGLRGLVTELTPELVADHIRAFLAVTGPVLGPVSRPVSGTDTALYLGRDLRESSPLLAEVVKATALAEGVAVVDCGALPTPALALAAMGAGGRAVMVTGSHIPADRNGLKFYTTAGEITKADEAAILGALGRSPAGKTAGAETNLAETDMTAAARYGARYITAFGPALQGARIGLWAHSSVGRDLLAQTLRALGAEVTELGRSDHFIPVDTEAVDAPTRDLLRGWAAGGAYDAIVSTDGDADRPLLCDQHGQVIPGDILGQITARALEAAIVVTPVSSNSGAEDHFDTRRTKIGSPYVIAAMEQEAGSANSGALSSIALSSVVGYEANGGFLLGFDALGPAGPLPRLMTRDAFLPIIATLAAARGPQGFDLTARAAAEPARFTATDRIEHIPPEISARFLRQLLTDELTRAALLENLSLSGAHMIDTTDGLRMTTAEGTVLHLRPSGNAPEFRIYAETASRATADALLARALGRIAAGLGSGRLSA